VMMAPGVTLEPVSLQQLVVAMSRNTGASATPASQDLEELVR